MQEKVVFINRHKNKTLAQLEQMRMGVDRGRRQANTENLQLWIDELIKERSEIEEEAKSLFSTKLIEIDIIIAKSYLFKIESSASRGIEFSLTLPQWQSHMRRKRCQYTGVKLLDSTHTTHPHKRTVDRIDGSKGYITGNVATVSRAANQAKNLLFEQESSKAAMSKSEFLRFSEAMKKHLKP